MTRNTRRHKTIAYDPDGNRTVKEHGGEAMWVNPKHAGTMTDTVTCSIYPNPYININGNRWTKHYYIGGERIASMTGTISGEFEGLNATENQAAGHDSGMTIRYDNMRDAEEDSIDSTYARLGLPYGAHQTNTRGDGWYLYLPATREDESNDRNETADNPENGQLRNNPIALRDGQMYYYQRDHLGSTMSVTDSLGNIVQLVEYTPWGEVFVERRFGTSGFDTPYLFNGKELDEETGLYYYGARYYDPKMSVWYSTDPMEIDYPSVSTYGYCLGNPIKFLDPNGKEIRISWTLREKGKVTQRYFLYKGGKLYFENGKLYNGNIIYARAVQKDLNLLSNENSLLKDRIKELEKSKHIHIITLGKSEKDGNSNTPANIHKDKSHIPTGSLTQYNPYTDDDGNGGKRPPRIGLAHELLGHGYNTDKGKSDYRKTSNGIPKYEVQAVNIENVARSAINEPKRTTYGKEIPTNELWDNHQ